MAASEQLQKLFIQSLEKYKIKCDTFEEHFAWLEEALVLAKQSFTHTEQTLLPKTPAAKKRGRQKESTGTFEDGESPFKRASINSNVSQVEPSVPECLPPRRGRAASRAAQEKLTQTIKDSRRRKLRRPSTPEEVYRTTRKTKPTKQVQYRRESVEIEEIKSNETTDSEIAAAQSTEKSPEALAFDRVEETQALGKSDCSSNSIGKRLIYEKVPKEDATEPIKSTAIDTEILDVDDGGDCPMEDENVTEERKKDSGIGECDEEEPSSKTDNNTDQEIEALHSPMDTCSEDKDEGVEVLSNVETFKEAVVLVEDCKEIVEASQPCPIPKARSTRTKQKEVVTESLYEDFNQNSSPQPIPKPRTTRTKQRIETLEACSSAITNIPTMHVDLEKSKSKVEEPNEADLPPPAVPKIRSTRTKKKKESVEVLDSHMGNSDIKHNDSEVSETESIAKEASQNSIFLPPEIPQNRSTRTKKKQTRDSTVSDDSNSVPKSRSTRTKKKMEEQARIESSSEYAHSQEDSEFCDTSAPHSRSTRTKKRQVEEQVTPPARTTRTKKRKMEGEQNKNQLTDSDEMKSTFSPESKASSLIKKYHPSTWSLCQKKDHRSPAKRVTRSKIKQVNVTPKKDSPYAPKNFKSPVSKSDFQRDCCSPMSDKGTPKNRQHKGSRVDSPLRNSPRFYNSDKTAQAGHTRAPFKNVDAISEVEEITNDIEVTRSPARITRHSQGKGVKTPDSRWGKINPQPRTPSPQCPSEKIVRPKMGYGMSGNSSHGSSGRITPKTYSRIRPGLLNSASASSSSVEYNKTQKKMNTPNDAKRVKNLVSGVTSFIRVQPPKPTRVELESKKQLELQKKKEREEETRKKKEEILKLKVEEQKRRNEERMKRAKEAREHNQKKAEEAKELQKTERKQREDRLREEQQKKKQQFLAKKQAEDEAKARKIKEQMEEERRRQEEIRLAEEVRKAEEEVRRQEEERKVEQERLHQEEVKKKRIAEVERIARERKEMEQLKIREAERLAAAKKAKMDAIAAQKAATSITDTVNALHNSTFNKENNLNTTYNANQNSNLNTTYTNNSGNFNTTYINGGGNLNTTYTNQNSTFTKGNSAGKQGESYEMTPDHKKKKAKTVQQKSANNYNINDIKSDDSTDDETAPKKNVPTWASGTQLKAALINQEYYPPNIDSIFPPEDLLIMPDLMKIFTIVRQRFFKRTSSAIWNTPPSKLL